MLSLINEASFGYLMTPFHLAFPIRDIESTRHFYCTVLECKEGRSTEHWIDFDFWGHQLSAHVNSDLEPNTTSEVENIQVPLRHFGAILEWNDWEKLSLRLEHYGIVFIVKPYIRFEGQAGEQGTFFIKDPSGNALEFKTYKHEEKIFEL